MNNKTISAKIGHSEFERQSAFSRTWNSIRTRYSLATAVLLLSALAILYVGGRVVLVHLLRDTEQQVREIGTDITRIAYRGSEKVRGKAFAAAQKLATDQASLLKAVNGKNAEFSLAAAFADDGSMKAGAVRGASGEAKAIAAEDLAPYAEVLRAWCAATRGAASRSGATGIVNLRGGFHYASMVCGGEGCVLLGIPFDTGSFSSQLNEGFSGVDIRITSRRTDVAVSTMRPPENVRQSSARSGFGIAPMLSEAINFYTGGFWELGANSFEAVYAVRDIAGNAISMVSVSIPKTFSSVTNAAIGRLAFFIAFVGMLLVLPIFWFQSRVLLNPLTRMIEKIAELGAHHRDTDCPRLEWHGKDEFALLAVSVNRMLETLSARSVAVAQSEARQQALIDCLPDALAIFDPEGRLISVMKVFENRPPMPGLCPGETPSPAVFGKEPVEKFLAALRETFARGTIGKVRLKVQRLIGVPRSTPTRHFELRITRMDDHFALAILRDTTDEVAEHKRRLAAEARESDSKKRESLTALAAGIAHDMNNILSVVLNAAEAEGADPSGDSVKTLETIRDAVRRGTGMMRELRTYAGENRIVLHRMHAGFIVEDIRLLAERVVGRNIIFSFEAADDAPDVDVDPNQFWKVFFNILKNAGEAIGEDRPGHIAVRCERCEMTPELAAHFLSERPLPAGAGTLFTIADDGPGIAAELLPRLFDPYVSSKAVGRGLGLATARTIVEAHGGGLAVKSKVDAGTTFEFYLPETRLPVEEKGAEAAASDGDAVRREVLVVDDEAAILKTSSILIRAIKLVPFTAKDNAEALAVVRRHAATLRAILLDADLGGTDTVRLLGAFRSSAPSVRVIVSSGSSEEDIRKLFATHPYDGFLAKPYTLDELRTALGAGI